MNDGNRRAPGALARDEPVPQAVRRGGPTLALLFQPSDDLGDGLGRTPPVERAGVHHEALAGPRLGHSLRVQLAVIRLDDHADVKAMLAGELEVALVVKGDAHDGSRPVFHEHVGGHEAGNLLAVHRIHRVDAERDPLSRQRLVSLRGLGPLQPVLHFLDRFSGPAGLGQLAHQWMFGSEREERDAP